MNRWALITGASKGIGKELAFNLVERGWNVILVARSQGLLQEQTAAFNTDGERARMFVCDLCVPQQRATLIKQIEDWGIDVDLLVNNAGFGTNGLFMTLDRERELQQIELNVMALVDLTHRCLPGMKERGRGYILNIASTAAFQPGPHMAVYFATKAFVLHFSEALAVELKSHGISVTAHCPGATDSEFGATAGNADSLLFALGSMSSREVAVHALEATLNRRRLAIPGWRNWSQTILIRFVPRALVAVAVSYFNRPMLKRKPSTD